MIMLSQAKIFLAEERGMNETRSFRSFQTFNFGKYFNEYKNPVGDIYLLNDDILDGDRSISMLLEEDSIVILLPVVGAIRYTDSLNNSSLLAAGQVQLISLAEGSSFSVSNPFKEDLVNFIQVWIRAEHRPPLSNPFINTYDVNERIDTLSIISNLATNDQPLPFALSIGKFNGRGETIYQPQTENVAVFIFVLEGAFEVEGRLLHARDGLALWKTDTIEMEALSNDAILFIIEQRGK